jgi:hypothetical protein
MKEEEVRERERERQTDRSVNQCPRMKQKVEDAEHEGKEGSGKSTEWKHVTQSVTGADVIHWTGHCSLA